jgi:periplasmic protein TonB
MTRPDPLALVLSGALHGAVLGAALAVAWQGHVPSLRFMPVELIAPEPETRAADARPALTPPRLVPAPARRAASLRWPAAAPRQPLTESREAEAPPVTPRPPTVTITEVPAASTAPEPASDNAAALVLATAHANGPRQSEQQPAAAGGPSLAAVAPPSAAGPQITLTARPRGGYQIRPPYPAEARRAGAEGTTLLRVHVAADGRIDQLHVERSAGHAALDRAAAETISKWQFEPARSGTTAVAVWVLIPVDFRLEQDF